MNNFELLIIQQKLTDTVLTKLLEQLKTEGYCINLRSEVLGLPWWPSG